MVTLPDTDHFPKRMPLVPFSVKAPPLQQPAPTGTQRPPSPTPTPLTPSHGCLCPGCIQQSWPGTLTLIPSTPGHPSSFCLGPVSRISSTHLQRPCHTAMSRRAASHSVRSASPSCQKTGPRSRAEPAATSTSSLARFPAHNFLRPERLPQKGTAHRTPSRPSPW